jgi:hypothetical protein
MTTTINETEKLTLIDGTVIEVRPLKLSLLRKFMTTFEGISEVAENNDKSMDLLIECVAIALEQYKPELATDKKALEELLDLPLVYKIIEAASGINLAGADLLNI